MSFITARTSDPQIPRMLSLSSQSRISDRSVRSLDRWTIYWFLIAEIDRMAKAGGGYVVRRGEGSLMDMVSGKLFASFVSCVRSLQDIYALQKC